MNFFLKNANFRVRRFSDAINRRKSVAFGAAKAKTLRRHSHQPLSMLEQEEKEKARRKVALRGWNRILKF